MKLCENNGVSLRMLASEDKDLLLKWLSDPVVLEYYEGRDHVHDELQVQQHFYVNRDGIEGCIIQYANIDIGYLQFYEIDQTEREEYGYTSVKDKIYGMDQFIGEPEFWNQGIGTQVIKMTVQYLTDKLDAERIVMDPQAWNTRALRVYEKCGFRQVKLLPNHEWHEGSYRDCWLIEYTS
ncbi:GNAT family N-acetyltransferase [Paenibacillus sp. PDC88]|uniref:GNAT family N-acetyltransferase n=1 Tax=Paenibacillus sp. PDC88 TaxID=1884375 RepID=UPI0008984965|nr:GNAT family N-acetyltransferase [Paenibacillus sp. PDC88]SDW10873.1 aminoglycoside 6'-N-acetyltransferase [Paenibacillus sp. PDC88]